MNLVTQLVELTQKYIPTGQSDESLASHFQYELDHDEIAWMGRGDKVLAFCDWSWISEQADIQPAHEGQPTSGPVLCILNLVLTEPRLMWPGYRLLPDHRWMVWRDYLTHEIHAPKGWPHVEVTA